MKKKKNKDELTECRKRIDKFQEKYKYIMARDIPLCDMLKFFADQSYIEYMERI